MRIENVKIAIGGKIKHSAYILLRLKMAIEPVTKNQIKLDVGKIIFLESLHMILFGPYLN